MVLNKYGEMGAKKEHICEQIHAYGMTMYAKGFNDAVAINAKKEFEE